ncbi:MAG: hypothetical protein AB1410_02940 [Acidobacteriota bacterium]
MKKIWIGLYSISMMWILLLPIFTPKNWIYFIFLFFGLTIAIWAFWNFEIEKINYSLYIFLIPVLIFILFIPYPFNLGGIFLLFGGIFSIFHKKYKISHPISLGFFMQGLILLIQTLVHPFYIYFASRYHGIDLLNPFFSFLGRISGLISSFEKDSVILKSPEGMISISTTWESLGLYPILNILTGGIILIILFSSKIKKEILTLFSIIFIFGILRYLIILFFLTDSSSISILWKPHWIILSFIVLPFILGKFISFKEKENHRNININFGSLNLRHLLLFLLISLGVFSFIGFWGFNDPGEKKSGRLLIDEAHSDWEWTEKVYDTEWYGERSGYNYYCLKDFLNHFYHINVNKKEILPDLLNKHDILIIKTPTKPFSRREISAIKDFVRNGRGLLLIGDHTNVFGMGTYLNPIANLFGFRFKYDATYDLSTGSLSLYNPKKILPHPVINNMPFFLFATSCTLKAPIFSENVILGYGLRAHEADYSQRNFFPKNPHKEIKMEYGLFVQMGGKKYGKGRVLLFTDSTCFSNFSMFMPGKPELILGSIEWLNRKNKYNLLNWILILISLISIILIIRLSKRINKKEFLLLILFSSLIASSSGIKIIERINKVNYPTPKAHTRYFRVSFDSEHSNFYLPAKKFTPQRKDNLTTFYVWTQRLGIFPNLGLKFIDSLNENDAIVIVNSSKPFSEKERNQFLSYVKKGGKALIMDDPRNIETSTAFQLLSPFGLRMEYYEIKKGKIVDKEGEEIFNGEHLGAVYGGEPLLFVVPEKERKVQNPIISKNRKNSDLKIKNSNKSKEKEEKTPILTMVKKGDGVVVLLGCSYIFFNESMKTTSAIPDASLRKLYDLEFWIFKDLLELDKNRLSKNGDER